MSLCTIFDYVALRYEKILFFVLLYAFLAVDGDG